MRTILLVGIAAIAAWSADAANATQHSDTQVRTERRVIVVSPDATEDAAVYRSANDRAPTERDYRGRWEGQWNGTWEGPDGQRYRGTYDGNYDDARGVSYDTDDGADNGRTDRGPDYRDGRRDARPDQRGDRYGRSRDFGDGELARLCRRDNGAGGAVIGAVVGGIAGNRIAGRGNRTAGTLIGGGVGALAGLAVDRAEDRAACDAYWRRVDGDNGSYGYRSYGNNGYERYDSSVYGYGPGTTTTTIYPGQPVIVEETETTYETVTVAAPRTRHAPRRRVHRAAPRPRPHCTCR